MTTDQLDLLLFAQCTGVRILYNKGEYPVAYMTDLNGELIFHHCGKGPTPSEAVAALKRKVEDEG